MTKIAEKMDTTLFSKKINHEGEKTDKRPITKEEINNICLIIDFPLSSAKVNIKIG